MFGGPDLPEPPASVPPPSTTDASEAAARERQRSRLARGRRGTIIAGAGGVAPLTADANPQGKTRLGQ